MKIERYENESNVAPVDFAVRNLGKHLFEIVENRNIEEKTIKQEEGEETIYKSDLTILTTTVCNRKDGVVALIRLRYSQDDEFNRINDGIKNSQDAKYLEYRNYVEFCKEQSHIYFSN